MPLDNKEGEEIARYPAVMQSKEAFQQFVADSMDLFGKHSTWLSIEVTRELNYLQDYLVTVYKNLQHVPTEHYPEIGEILRQDFVDLSSQIEKRAFKFFQKDLPRLRLNDLTKWHKYPINTTQKRLKETAILKRQNEIHAIYVLVHKLSDDISS